MTSHRDATFALTILVRTSFFVWIWKSDSWAAILTVAILSVSVSMGWVRACCFCFAGVSEYIKTVLVQRVGFILWMWMFEKILLFFNDILFTLTLHLFAFSLLFNNSFSILLWLHIKNLTIVFLWLSVCVFVYVLFVFVKCYFIIV